VVLSLGRKLVSVMMMGFFFGTEYDPGVDLVELVDLTEQHGPQILYEAMVEIFPVGSPIRKRLKTNLGKTSFVS